MVEVWLFGRLVATLASAFAVVLVIVALTSITYLAMTLAPALRLGDPRADRAARALGISCAAIALLGAAMGLRVGAPGALELVPTIAVAVAAAAAIGAGSALLTLGGGRARLALGAARARRSAQILGRARESARRVGESRRAFLAADDLKVELAHAVAAVARLSAALTNLTATRAEVEARLARIDDADAAGDLARELRRTRDEVATKIELGDKIMRAARASTFRIAAAAPLTRLLRRRPRRIAAGLSNGGAVVGVDRLAAVGEELDAFLTLVDAARAELAEVEATRPSEMDDDDPIPQAKRDVDAVEAAYRAVRERLDVVRLRLAARADLDTVAAAAGEVSDKARASGLPADDLRDLIDEVTRAESAIVMATPPDFDARALTATLCRGTDALGGRDGASLDELLRALREIA